MPMLLRLPGLLAIVPQNSPRLRELQQSQMFTALASSCSNSLQVQPLYEVADLTSHAKSLLNVLL